MLRLVGVAAARGDVFEVFLGNEASGGCVEVAECRAPSRC